MFASREVGQLAERDLIGLAPLLFVGFSTWLARNGPGGFRTRAAAAILAAAAVLAIPLGRFVGPDALPSAFSIVPLLHLRELSSLHTTELVLGLACRGGRVPVRDRPAPRPPRPARARRPGARRRVGVGEP